jgi:hypothetical protein
MGMHIDAARQYVAAIRVNHFSTIDCQVLPDGADAPVLNQQIGFERTFGADHRTILDEALHLFQAQG